MMATYMHPYAHKARKLTAADIGKKVARTEPPASPFISLTTYISPFSSVLKDVKTNGSDTFFLTRLGGSDLGFDVLTEDEMDDKWVVENEVEGINMNMVEFTEHVGQLTMASVAPENDAQLIHEFQTEVSHGFPGEFELESLLTWFKYIDESGQLLKPIDTFLADQKVQIFTSANVDQLIIDLIDESDDAVGSPATIQVDMVFSDVSPYHPEKPENDFDGDETYPPLEYIQAKGIGKLIEYDDFLPAADFLLLQPFCDIPEGHRVWVHLTQIDRVTICSTHPDNVPEFLEENEIRWANHPDVQICNKEMHLEFTNVTSE